MGGRSGLPSRIRGMEKAKRRRTDPVDRMSEMEVRLILKKVVADVRAGFRHGSSADVGDMVISTLKKAGLAVDTSRRARPFQETGI